jgi:phospholipid-binding lipoprotein MlaA
MAIVTRRRTTCALALAAFVILGGCARSPGVPGAEGTLAAARLAQADDDYDPWQPFNELMFSFNHDVLDRYVVKPAAQGWEKVLPEVARRSVSRFFDNLEMPRRLVNNLLQARPLGAGREVVRFVLNTSIGVAGLLDVATPLHIRESDADAGETLALYGVGAGPYLVLPTMAPATVRDAIGHGIDGALDPIGYLLPFVANRVMSVTKAINDRSLHLKLFANVEDSVIDLYSAARNGYLQRRERVIELAVEDRDRQWSWLRRDEPRAYARQLEPTTVPNPGDAS